MNELAKNEFEIEGEGEYIEPPKMILRDHVETSVENYFQVLEGMDQSLEPTEAKHLYCMVLAEVEPPMLEVVMKRTRHNQTKAANVLGLNRGTLRKKLKLYGML